MPYTPPTPTTPTATQLSQIGYLTGYTSSAVAGAITTTPSNTVSILQSQVIALSKIVMILVLLLADCLASASMDAGWSDDSGSGV